MSGNPYRLIEETAALVRRRRREAVLLPALPPTLATLAALLLGCLPLELAWAATIAAGILAIHVAGLDFGHRDAAALLDRELAAKEHFLTLATITGDPPLRAAVESGAAAIAEANPLPAPPRPARPIVVSTIVSILLFAFLWMLPRMASFGGAGSLDRIADELAASGDATDEELARSLKALSDSLRDPTLSKEEKQQKIAEMIEKLDKAEQQQKQKQQQAGSSGSGGESGKQGEQQSDKGERQGKGEQQSAEGQASGARSEARKQLEKLAGEQSGGEQQRPSKGDQPNDKKSEASGGGIKGPEDGAKERKQGEREQTGNQPGKNPDQKGGNEKPGESQGQAKAEQNQQPQQPDQQNPQGTGQGAGEGEGASKQPSQQSSDKPADRFFKNGEGPGGRIVDGRYVRIRVPEEQRQLAGTEEVAKPGEVVSEVPYGNAPLPPPGAPGDVSAEQPVPLEYRGALGAQK